MYNGTKEGLHERNYLAQARLLDVAGSGALGGALAGAVICFGSAREFLPICIIRRRNMDEQHLNLLRCVFGRTSRLPPSYSSSGSTTT
jgi:hypothetical protein